jgi:hypothetical protein
MMSSCSRSLKLLTVDGPGSAGTVGERRSWSWSCAFRWMDQWGGNGAGKTNKAAGSEPGGLVRGDLTLVLRQNSCEGAGVSRLDPNVSTVTGLCSVDMWSPHTQSWPKVGACRSTASRPERCTGVRARRSRADDGGGRLAHHGSSRLVAGAEVRTRMGTQPRTGRAGQGSFRDSYEFPPVPTVPPRALAGVRATARVTRGSRVVRRRLDPRVAAVVEAATAAEADAEDAIVRRPSPVDRRRDPRTQRGRCAAPPRPGVVDQLGPGDELVVVDDHSGDTTGEVAARLGARVLDPAGAAGRLVGQAARVLARRGGPPPHRSWCSSTPMCARRRDLLDASPPPGRSGPGAPWSRCSRGTRPSRWAEQASLLANVTALMGSGGFTVAGPSDTRTWRSGRCSPSPVRPTTTSEGTAPCAPCTPRTSAGAPRGRAALYTGRPDTSFRMYPDGLGQARAGLDAQHRDRRAFHVVVVVARRHAVGVVARRRLARRTARVSPQRAAVLGARTAGRLDASGHGPAVSPGGGGVRLDLPAQRVRTGVPARRELEAAIGGCPPD